MMLYTLFFLLNLHQKTIQIIRGQNPVNCFVILCQIQIIQFRRPLKLYNQIIRPEKSFKKMLFKIAYKDETHLMKSKEENSFEDLQKYVLKAFKILPGKFTFVYIDEDGDEINLDNQHDFNSLRDTGMNKINVRIIQIKPVSKYETQQAKSQPQRIEVSFVPAPKPKSMVYEEKIEADEKTETIDEFMLKRSSQKVIDKVQKDLKIQKEEKEEEEEEEEENSDEELQNQKKEQEKIIYRLEQGDRRHGYKYKRVMNGEKKQQKKEEDPRHNFIHDDITCDNCGISPIIGNRFKCNVCPNYDLCESCEQDFGHDHALLKIKYRDQEYERAVEDQSAVMIVGKTLHKGVNVVKNGFFYLIKNIFYVAEAEEVPEGKKKSKKSKGRKEGVKKDEANVKSEPKVEPKVIKEQIKKPQSEEDRLVESANYLNSILGIDFTRCYAFVKKNPTLNNQELIVQYFDNIKSI